MSSRTAQFIQTVFRPGPLAPEVAWRLELKAALGMLLVMIATSLIGWFYLTQASSLTTTSFRIEKLRVELSRLNLRNTELKLEIARAEDLAEIEQRAHELGFQPPGQVVFLSVANYPVPSPDELPSRAYSR